MRFWCVAASGYQLWFLYLTGEPHCVLVLLAAPGAVRWNSVMFVQQHMAKELELQLNRLNDIAARKWAVSKSGIMTCEHTRSFGGLCHTVKSYTLLVTKWQLCARKSRCVVQTPSGNAESLTNTRLLAPYMLRSSLKANRLKNLSFFDLMIIWFH